MPKIMINGIEYAGSGGDGNTISMELTQAEYDALPSTKLTDDIMYMITDGNNPNVITASQVMYDNTDSGLSANRVQSAIDETNTLLSAIPNLNSIEWKTATRNDAGGFTGGQCRYIKCGKLVIGIIEDLIGVNSTHNAVVFSNLPIPQSGMVGLIQMMGGQFKAPFRVRIGGGNIVNWYSSINNAQGSEGYMTFVYVSQ